LIFPDNLEHLKYDFRSVIPGQAWMDTFVGITEKPFPPAQRKRIFTFGEQAFKSANF